MSKSIRYTPEIRERAVRLVQEAQKDHSSQWAAIQSIQLERENRELKRANEILRKSLAYFAQAELGGRPN